MKKVIAILLMFSFVFVQEPCEGTCLSEEESINITNNIQELQFNLDKQLKINENLNSQIYIYIQPKWYENKWIWFGLGVIATAGSVKLAGEIVD